MNAPTAMSLSTIWDLYEQLNVQDCSQKERRGRNTPVSFNGRREHVGKQSQRSYTRTNTSQYTLTRMKDDLGKAEKCFFGKSQMQARCH
jgi:hypothetical protein